MQNVFQNVAGSNSTLFSSFLKEDIKKSTDRIAVLWNFTEEEGRMV